MEQTGHRATFRVRTIYWQSLMARDCSLPWGGKERLSHPLMAPLGQAERRAGQTTISFQWRSVIRCFWHLATMAGYSPHWMERVGPTYFKAPLGSAAWRAA